jgi:two-component system response regulator
VETPAPLATESPARSDAAADILLVEDNPIDAELTLRALKRSGLGHRVEHVTDGEEALDYLASVSLFSQKDQAPVPRLILLDLGLHKISGLHVLRRLKSDERTRSIPVIVLTSSKVAIEAVESYKLGVNSYVIKPTDADRFAEVVAAIGHYWLGINEPPPP